MERATLLSNLSSRRRQIEEGKTPISRQRFMPQHSGRPGGAGRYGSFLVSLAANRIELEAEPAQHRSINDGCSKNAQNLQGRRAEQHDAGQIKERCHRKPPVQDWSPDAAMASTF